jgi:hypothetical protein
VLHPTPPTHLFHLLPLPNRKKDANSGAVLYANISGALKKKVLFLQNPVTQRHARSFPLPSSSFAL